VLVYMININIVKIKKATIEEAFFINIRVKIKHLTSHSFP